VGFADEAMVVLVAGWPTPVPFNAISVDSPSRLFDMKSTPFCAPAIVGVKATLIMHSDQTESGEDDGQLSVSLKLPSERSGHAIAAHC
jgi:hypothetical protein